MPTKTARAKNRTKSSRRLTLKDRLSRLTYTRACQLLGPKGAEMIRRGSAAYQDIQIERDVYLRGDLFRLKLPGAGAGGKDAVATITAMADARNRLRFNCIQQDLIDYLNTQASKIQSLQATVDIDASTGRRQERPHHRLQRDSSPYVLVRKPSMLRMKGLMPLVRNTAFDMVSDGQQFKVWIPTKNKFVMGSNSSENYDPDKRLENMRPQYIYDA